MASTIFVVDSSPAVRRMVEQLSPPDDYHLMAFEDGPTALEAARKLSPHLIVADYHLDNITFFGILQRDRQGRQSGRDAHRLDHGRLRPRR